MMLLMKIIIINNGNNNKYKNKCNNTKAIPTILIHNDKAYNNH